MGKGCSYLKADNLKIPHKEICLCGLTKICRLYTHTLFSICVFKKYQNYKSHVTKGENKVYDLCMRRR